MNKGIKISLLGLLVMGVCTTNYLSAQESIDNLTTPIADAKVLTIPTINLTAKSYYLVDFHSGDVLASKNEEMTIEPASLTKIMTAYIIFYYIKHDLIELTDLVKIGKNAYRAEGSSMFLEIGSSVTIDELIKGLLIQSGNDAAIALAEFIDGDEETFALRMNKFAENLGMLKSNFVNATGLPNKNHYTTAKDLFTLTRSLIAEYPEFYKLYAIKSYTYNKITQSNRNRLLFTYDGADGVKTGHTKSAGYNLVGSAKRDDMRLISIALGLRNDKERTHEASKLLDFGFNFFTTYRLFKGGAAIDKTSVWLGSDSKVELGLKEDLYVTVQKNSYSKISSKIILKNKIFAPLEENSNLGTMQVFFKDKLIKEVDIINLKKVDRANVLSRMFSKIYMFFYYL